MIQNVTIKTYARQWKNGNNPNDYQIYRAAQQAKVNVSASIYNSNITTNTDAHKVRSADNTKCNNKDICKTMKNGNNPNDYQIGRATQQAKVDASTNILT